MKRLPRKRPPARDPLFNDSVGKALALLEIFGGERRSLTLAELAASAGMTLSSAQRCTHTLARLGYLRRDARARRWALTPRTVSLSHAYLTGHTLIEQATRPLAALSQSSGESVSLSEPDDTDMVFIARFPSRRRFPIHMPVGHRLPMYCTASGRAYLAALPQAAMRRILRRSRLRALTPYTLTRPAEIVRRVRATRALGYAWTNQECYRGDLTIGAAVLGGDGLPVAAVNVSAPSSRWTLAELRSKLAPVLLDTVRAISGHDSTMINRGR